ncbi:iron complex transport system substrate-binding protein [Sphaerotilus hippei]|uniref:Iron complex transport system substrate-binding protein n=1 Tax=Sphaerotilus hippei TaxID=744406 RepID=A0A318H3E2_9BURK|nr:helical backbone metal receptor [Sphaerotilus hippei]PXW93280.1 iron complex transport system substrate-binding protein [Sphaerotilus hippei]
MSRALRLGRVRPPSWWRCGFIHRALAAVLLVAGLLATAAGARAQPVHLRDDRGAELVLAQPPQRLVSLLPSLTEAVCALGACERLVGVDRHSNWPASVARLPSLGGLDDAQIERIVALRPDVVVAGLSSRALERLESLGVKVFAIEAKDHADVRRSLGLLATLIGRPEQGPLLWSRIEAQLQQAAGRTPARLRGQRVYFEIDAAPYAAGTSSFIGETLTRLGLGNIVPPPLGPFPKLNPEFIVRARPDLIMAVQRNLASMPARPGWSTLAALRSGQTCGFDAERYDMLVRPGPRMGEAALLVASCLERLDRAPR